MKEKEIADYETRREKHFINLATAINAKYKNDILQRGVLIRDLGEIWSYVVDLETGELI